MLLKIKKSLQSISVWKMRLNSSHFCQYALDFYLEILITFLSTLDVFNVPARIFELKPEG